MSFNFPPLAKEEQQWLITFILALDDCSIPVFLFEDLLSRPIPIPTSSRQPNGDILKAHEITHDMLLNVEEDYRCALREAVEVDVDVSAFEVAPMRVEYGHGFEESDMIKDLSRGGFQSRILEAVRELRWIQEQILRVDGEIANKMRQ